MKQVKQMGALRLV